MIFDGIETRFTKESPTRILILTLRLGYATYERKGVTECQELQRNS